MRVCFLARSRTLPLSRCVVEIKLVQISHCKLHHIYLINKICVEEACCSVEGCYKSRGCIADRAFIRIKPGVLFGQGHELLYCHVLLGH